MLNIRQGRMAAFALAIASGGAIAAPAAATTLEITITNNAPIGGFAITPLFGAFHDGSYDPFDVGSAASAGLQSIAELGDVSGLPGELAAADPNATSVVIAAPQSGPPTIDPGESTSVTITLNPTEELYFSFLSMIVPSNDTFLGSDDPTAHQLFDSAGLYTGDVTIDVTGSFLFDAGTEVNDPLRGPAFVIGQEATAGAAENGTVQRASSLLDFAGVQTPLGPLDGGLIDFTANPGAFSIATITISQVAPVPLPATGLLLLGGFAVLGASRMKRRKART
ncbi:spondin domain-containing protein [Actibacterium lipolyticum]|uniref:Spondin_N n=1 Tax=Actibacterium lipolyticum TaxID=1524263 RepID=A0A238KTN4_9RHOB|nr:spondin domain-containing protein [Actibacterium lipolyticum]SMX46159.1 Spondin_N [Actibacterium lipolyticum]